MTKTTALLVVLVATLFTTALSGCVRPSTPTAGRGAYRGPPRARGESLASFVVRYGEMDLQCPRRALSAREIAPGVFELAGCRQVQQYVCDRSACQRYSPRRGGRATASTADADARATARGEGAWSDAQIRQMLAVVHDPIVACLPAGLEVLRLRIGISPEGDVRRMDRGATTPDAETCIDAVLASGRMGGSVREGRFVMLEFRRDLRGRGATQAIMSADPTEQPTTEAPPPPPEPVRAPDVAARAAVDGRAASILACVEADALSMQVSWDTDGRLDALLRGAHQGTLEEACVRAVVQALSITPRPGREGVIVHAVQR